MKQLDQGKRFNQAEKLADADPAAALREVEDLLIREQAWLKATRFEDALYGLRGWCHFQLGDHQAARADLARSIKKRGVAYENSLNKRACMLLALGDLRGARADVVRAMKGETWSDTRYEQSGYRTTQAEIESAAGDHEAALWALQRALKIPVGRSWARWARSTPTLARTREDPRFEELMAGRLLLWPSYLLGRGLGLLGVPVPLVLPPPIRLGKHDVPAPMRVVFALERKRSLTLSADRKGKSEAHWSVLLRKRELAHASELAALPGKGKRPWLVFGQRAPAEGGERLLIALDDVSPHDPMAFAVRAGAVLGRQRLSAFLDRVTEA